MIVHGRDAARTHQVANAIREAGGVATVTLGDLGTDAGADAVAQVALAVRIDGGLIKSAF